MVDDAFFRDLIIAFSMFVGAGLGLPFPEEVLIVAAGIWAGSHGQYGGFEWLMLPVCVVGVLIADFILYFVGRYFGVRLLRFRLAQKLLPADKLLRIEQNFDKYGVGILLFGRLLPGIRAPLFITSGLMRVPLSRFLLADGLGAVLGNGLLFFLGWWFGDAFQRVIENVERGVSESKPIIVMAALALGGVYMAYRFLRKPVMTGDPKELPLIGKQVAARLDCSDPANRGKPECADAAACAPTPGAGVTGPEGGG